MICLSSPWLWILPPGCDVVLFYRIKFCYSLSILKSVCRLLCVLLQRPIQFICEFPTSQNSYNRLVRFSGVFWMVLYCQVQWGHGVVTELQQCVFFLSLSRWRACIQNRVERRLYGSDFKPCRHCTGSRRLTVHTPGIWALNEAAKPLGTLYFYVFLHTDVYKL